MTEMDSAPVRIGVFGGSFDPPHIGHFYCARVAAEILGLHRVLVIPAAVQPHKTAGTVAPDKIRCEMIQALIKDDPLFELSTLELERGGVSYTIDTLRILSQQYQAPQHELYLLIGTDAINEFDTWRNPDEIFALAGVVVMKRQGIEVYNDKDRWVKRAVKVEIPRLEISSSSIRERIAAGLPVKMIVGEEVDEIIRRNGLYRG